MNIKRFVSALCVFTAAACAGVLPAAASQDQTSSYVENEWNFVDGSIDTGSGIMENASGVLGRIERNKVLRVATEPDQPPFSYIESGKTGEDSYAGADILLAQMIADRLGAELRILPADSIQLLPALTEDQCDLSISAILFTPSRALSYTMSKGYYYPEEVPEIGFLIQEAKQKDVKSLSDLEGKVIVAQSNSIAETIGITHIYNYREFRRTSTAHGVFEMVQNGSAEAGIVQVRTAETYIKNNPDCGLCLIKDLVFEPDEQYLGFRVAAKKGETELIYFVNGVIDEILESGVYEEWVLASSGKGVQK